MSGAWTDMSVNGAQAVRTRNRTLDQVLATIPLQQKLDIGLYRLDQTTPGLSKALGDWGVFKLLDAYVDVKAARASRNTWRVKVPLKEFQGPGAALGAEGDVPIELQLDYPLPELDKWPRREDLNNLKAW
jgi:hypothetical protein